MAKYSPEAIGLYRRAVGRRFNSRFAAVNTSLTKLKTLGFSAVSHVLRLTDDDGLCRKDIVIA
jgi:hypothetical protein